MEALSLTWSQSPSPRIVQNKIYRSTGAGAYSLLATLGASTAYIDKSVSKGAIYNYKVTALDSIGSESSYSNPVTVNY